MPALLHSKLGWSFHLSIPPSSETHPLNKRTALPLLPTNSTGKSHLSVVFPKAEMRLPPESGSSSSSGQTESIGDSLQGLEFSKSQVVKEVELQELEEEN